MSFSDRLTRAPIPYDPVQGAEALACFDDLPTELRPLIAGAGGCSPFLLGLMRREGAWLRPAFEAPEAAVAALFAALRPLPLGDLGVALRQAKRRVALLTALADLGGVWSLEEVTGTLSDFADLAVDLALRALVAAETRRGKLPGLTQDDIETCGGMVVLAMGKGGARELNYSSDIDLICLFDESRFDPDDYHEARAGFIRVTRRMTALLSEMTGDGYVFRTDLRLRPDPSVTPVCLSMEAAERYYESVGRSWERAAHVKARPCAGDLAAGQAYLERLRPFIWRKHLDFAAIQDAHDMRLRIREHKGLGGAITLEGHDIKLGRGGIREIEFFTQTRQIIAGGRDPELRARATVPALGKLAEKGWVPEDVAKLLVTRYRAHREVEHRLQMVNDAQTHSLPATGEGMDRIARFMGAADTAAWRADLIAALDEVHTLTEGFFAPGMAAPQLPEMSEGSAAIVSRWKTYPALRSARAVEIFDRLKPDLLGRLARAARPEEALAQFDGFLAGLPAGVQLFALFEANPQLVELIVDICATAPALARHLSRNSGVFDAVIGGAFFAPWPGAAALTAELSGLLEQADDYERRLDTARRWMKEWHFRIGVHHLRGLIDAAEAGQGYADLAEAVVQALWPCVVAEFARKHGAPPGRGAVVVGMGSLGAGRLHAGSDLDLIVIYDAAGVEASDGRRPLAARSYYARLTQALVTALSAPMSEGRLYEVDMRLRPSGRQGPVATALASFYSYQREEAWTWEHLALTRARVIAGPAEIAEELEAFRAGLLAQKGQGATVLADVRDMRARIAGAKAPAGAWEAKLGPGRLQDIELTAQLAALRAGSPAQDLAGQLAAGQAAGWLTSADAATLSDSYALFWTLRAAGKLLSDKPLDLQEVGAGGAGFVLREAGQADETALRAAYDAAANRAAAVIERLLTPSPEGKETP